MSAATASSAPDHSAAYIDGQVAGGRFIKHLATTLPAGDDFHKIIRLHTAQLSPESDAFLSGFLRFVQKRLELLS